MILTQSTPQKIKAVSLIYNMTGSCSVPTEEFIKSGIAIISVVQSLERMGYRVKLRVSFIFAECDNERTLGTVAVKDYCEHLDLQKLCFPLAHPSMFRRFGFKWLETCSGLHSGWNCGYGRANIGSKKKGVFGK